MLFRSRAAGSSLWRAAGAGVDHVIDHHQKDKADRGEARVENLNELVSAARGFDPESDLPPLQSFLSHAVLESGTPRVTRGRTACR